MPQEVIRLIEVWLWIVIACFGVGLHSIRYILTRRHIRLVDACDSLGLIVGRGRIRTEAIRVSVTAANLFVGVTALAGFAVTYPLLRYTLPAVLVLNQALLEVQSLMDALDDRRIVRQSKGGEQ